MSDLIASNSFDALAREDDRGPYWTGRDLMTGFDYDKWERFEDAIERARVAIANVGQDPDAHASRLREAFGRTNQIGTNYRLTRYGAYMVAMNGDSRKPAIAAAQSYFAVKTYEAESKGVRSVHTLPDISTPAGVLAMAEQFAATARQLVAAETKVAELEPKADLADTYLIAEGGTRKVREAAKLLRVRERDLRRFLLDERLIFARHARCGDVQYDFYAEFAHHFQAIEHIVNHTWGSCSHYTLVITPRGIDLIRRRMAKVALPADEAANQLATAGAR